MPNVTPSAPNAQATPGPPARHIAPCKFCGAPMHYSRSKQTLNCASAACGYSVRAVPRRTLRLGAA